MLCNLDEVSELHHWDKPF